MAETTNYDYDLQLARMRRIGEIIAEHTNDKDREYASSWRRRGGIGAFMIIARKWDRIEAACEAEIREGELVDKYDLFGHFRVDDRPEGIVDDVVDLIGYLTVLLEYEIHCRQVGAIGGTKVFEDPILNPIRPKGSLQEGAVLGGAAVDQFELAARPKVPRRDGHPQPFGYDGEE